MKSKVSVRGQTVIPGPVRKALGITPGTRLDWEVGNGCAVVYVIPEDPIAAAWGILRGTGWTFQEFLRERQEERERERALEARDTPEP